MNPYVDPDPDSSQSESDQETNNDGEYSLPDRTEERTMRFRKDEKRRTRPPNSFLLFSNEHRKKLKEQNTGLDNKEISRILGEKWKAMREDEKEKYIRMADNLMKEYQHEEGIIKRRSRAKKLVAYVQIPKQPVQTEVRCAFTRCAVAPKCAIPPPGIDIVQQFFWAIGATHLFEDNGQFKEAETNTPIDRSYIIESMNSVRSRVNMTEEQARWYERELINFNQSITVEEREQISMSHRPGFLPHDVITRMPPPIPKELETDTEAIWLVLRRPRSNPE